MLCWCASWGSARLPGSVRLIRLAIILTVGLTLAPLAVDAQARPAISGWLAAAPSPALETFRQGFRDLGDAEGGAL